MGGMAEVYVARRRGPHGFTKRVALKRILPQYAEDSEFVNMFIDEARTAARLEHPNIVQVFDFGEAEKQLFLAMELVDGTNINRLLRAAYLSREVIPLDCALHIACQTARALDHAHRAVDEEGDPLNIVHRDVSPANILLTRDGHVKLSDFGIVHLAAADRYTGAGKVRGKPGYMSPEQVMGTGIGPSSDVFTLSTVLAELLMARPLFGEGNELDVLLKIRNVDCGALENCERPIPADVIRLIKMGLSFNPKDRPTATALADALQAMAAKRRHRGRSPQRLSTLLRKLELVIPSPADAAVSDAGIKPQWVAQLEQLTSSSSKPTGSTRTVETVEPGLYRVETHQGGAVDVNYAELVSLVTRGIVMSDTRVSAGGGDYGPAGALPELSRFVTSAGLRWDERETDRAAWSGEIGLQGLFAIAHGLAVERETGVLHMADGKRRKKIYFIDGRPEFIASTLRSELFGEYLIKTGSCTRADINRALAVLPKYEGRLGEALVGERVLRPGELFRAVSSQQRDRYLEAFRWRSGVCSYVRGERSQQESFPLAHDAYELLRDAVIEADPRQVEEALAPLLVAPLALAEHPPVPMTMFRLPQHWERILRKLKHATTLSRLIAQESQQGDVEPEEVCKLIFLATSCDLLEVSGING